MQIRQLTEPQKKEIEAVIFRVWQQIGADLEAACMECDERLTNTGAVEACLDADRPALFAGEEGRRVNALLRDLDGDAVRYFARRMRLV